MGRACDWPDDSEHLSAHVYSALSIGSQTLHYFNPIRKWMLHASQPPTHEAVNLVKEEGSERQALDFVLQAFTFYSAAASRW